MIRTLAPTYKVICCENDLKYPNQTFIDIAPAEFFTHEKLFFARQALYPELTADDEITGGIVLVDLGQGDIKLCYEMVCNRSLKLYQEHLRKRIDPLIKKMFKEMKIRGIDRTITHSSEGSAELFNYSMCYQHVVLSAKEESFIKKVERAKKREKLLEIKRQYYAAQKCAAQPQLLLAWKQAMYDGD